MYIGPLANCASALAALWSVRMVTKTFRQTRIDKEEELKAFQPKFRIKESEMSSKFTDSNKVAGYQLRIVLHNIKPNAAA